MTTTDHFVTGLVVGEVEDVDSVITITTNNSEA